MTGKEAIKILKCQALNNPDYPLVVDALHMAIEALEKIEKYEEICEYEEIDNFLDELMMLTL